MTDHPALVGNAKSTFTPKKQFLDRHNSVKHRVEEKLYYPNLEITNSWCNVQGERSTLNFHRHPDSVIRELAEHMPDMVFVNAGEGSISHPTQALLDMKTILDHKNSFDGLKIVIIGDLDHSRVTSSFVEGISNFDIESLSFCGHPEMCTNYQNTDVGKFEPDIERALEDADVVMTLRIQYERFEKDLNLDLDTYKSAYQLSSEKLGFAKSDAIIMHPGPVNYVEITEAVYDSENSVIRQQIANGVAIRMAVLSRFLSR